MGFISGEGGELKGLLSVNNFSVMSFFLVQF